MSNRKEANAIVRFFYELYHGQFNLLLRLFVQFWKHNIRFPQLLYYTKKYRTHQVIDTNVYVPKVTNETIQ